MQLAFSAIKDCDDILGLPESTSGPFFLTVLIPKLLSRDSPNSNTLSRFYRYKIPPN